MSLIDISGRSLLIAWFLYNFSFIVYVIALTGRKWSRREPAMHSRKWGRVAFYLGLAGVLLHMVFFFTRWYSAGHIPISNMFEFMTFLAMMIMIAYSVVYLIFRTPLLGIFAMPTGIIILAYAAVFPREIQPLIPALNSIWLYIHVTMAAAGEAFFAVGFAAGLIYLLRTVPFDEQSKRARKAQRGVEFTLFFIVIIIGFIVAAFAFRTAGYEAQFTKQTEYTDQEGQPYTVTETSHYVLPPIIQSHGTQIESVDPFLGMNKPLFQLPSWMEKVNAQKLNTVIWSVVFGSIIYLLLRLVMRKPLGKVISPITRGMDPEDLDEISYRAIAIGFPIFTLGGLIFASIWAHEAWGRYWAWDPKEVWAFITWLFYVAYLHLRLSRGWHGSRSAWLSVIGFVIVMFTLIGVNLIIAGFHTYAGAGT